MEVATSSVLSPQHSALFHLSVQNYKSKVFEHNFRYLGYDKTIANALSMLFFYTTQPNGASFIPLYSLLRDKQQTVCR